MAFRDYSDMISNVIINGRAASPFSPGSFEVHLGDDLAAYLHNSYRVTVIPNFPVIPAGAQRNAGIHPRAYRDGSPALRGCAAPAGDDEFGGCKGVDR